MTLTTNEGKEIETAGLSPMEVFEEGRKYERSFHRENPAAPEVFCEVDGIKCFVFDRTWVVYSKEDGKSDRIGWALHCCPRGRGDEHDKSGHTFLKSIYLPNLKYQWDDNDIYRQWERLRKGDDVWRIIFIVVGITVVLAILGSITNTFG